MKFTKRFLLSLLAVALVCSIYIGVIMAQDALISHNSLAHGSSLAAKIARDVYATAYNKSKARNLTPNILNCVDDMACIYPELKKLDKHIPSVKVNDLIGKKHEIYFSQKTPNVLYTRFRSFDFDFPPGINSLLPSEFIPSIKFLSEAQPSQSVIIDLRYNTGGSGWICLAIASMFIPSGEIIPVYKNPSWKFQFVQSLTLPRVFTINGIRGYLAGSMFLPSTIKPQVKAVYIVVNKRTASAAELFGIVLKKLSDQKIVFVGDSESYGVGNTINFPTKKYGIMVTAGIIKQYPEKIVPEMTITELENELGIMLDK